jgi:hypothetical protein
MKAKSQNGFFLLESHIPVHTRYIVSIGIANAVNSANKPIHAVRFLLFNGQAIDWPIGSKEECQMVIDDLFKDELKNVRDELVKSAKHFIPQLEGLLDAIIKDINNSGGYDSSYPDEDIMN